MLTRLRLFTKPWVIPVGVGLLFMATAAAPVESTSILCDANGDGAVDRHDALDLLRFLRHGGDPLPGNPDCNADGEVNFRDVVVMLHALLSGVVYRLYGLDFSPYLDGQDPNQGSMISEEQLRARLQIVAPYTVWIRTFGCNSGLEAAGRVAHEMGLPIALGAWLSDDETANEREITCLIQIAQAGQVDLAIVGSEVLLRGDLPPGQLVAYLQRVKAALPTIPVSTADAYGVLLDHPEVMAASDVVLVNYYPYWEGIDVNYAVAAIHAQHQRVVAAAGGRLVAVSETGWPSCGNTVGRAVASPENAVYYGVRTTFLKKLSLTYYTHNLR